MSTSQMPSAGAARPRSAAGFEAGPAQRLVLGRYRLQRALGAGGFATVWSARDERLERDVAVKILPRDRVQLSRFAREARAAARLAHPAIVMLYEAAIDDEAAYLVSELVRGKTLGELLEAGRCSDRDVVSISISICDALAHAHAEGVIHRDVKPSNILVPARSSSAGVAAKLTDFGVARLIGVDALTQTGEVIGTAAYMAPEQARGREADHAADLWSLALVTYEGLSGVGRAPRAAQLDGRRWPSTDGRASRHVPPLRRQRRAVSADLAAAVDRGLRPDPRKRGTLEEFRAALVAAREQADDTAGVIARSGWLGRQPDRDDAEPGRGCEEAPTRLAGLRAGDTLRGATPDRVRHEQRMALRTAGASWPWRALSAVCAALTTWWLCSNLLARAPIAPTAGALIAAAAVLVVPRLGLSLGGLALVVLAAAQGRPGGGLLLALVLAATVIAMPMHGRAWTLPCGAVLLGMLSLAGAWPALIGRSGLPARQRAALAAAGFVWLAAGSALSDRILYAHVHPSFPAAAAWIGSLPVTLHDIVIVMFDSGILAGAAVWALAAVLAPTLVGGRSIVQDAPLAAIWAAVTLVATELSARLFAVGALVPSPRGATLGAVLGGAILLAPVLAREGHPAGRQRVVGDRVP
ncbi:MAG: serine/threonine-protein kinase [Solirubrobacteraceae bacterium]